MASFVRPFSRALPAVPAAAPRGPVVTSPSCPWLAQVQGSKPSPDNATVLLENQDHTLGNALRFVLMRRCVGRLTVACAAHLLLRGRALAARCSTAPT